LKELGEMREKNTRQLSPDQGGLVSFGWDTEGGGGKTQKRKKYWSTFLEIIMLSNVARIEREKRMGPWTRRH